jgi:acyl-CoA thioester hydrolase
MALEPRPCAHRIRVRYGETDQMGVAYHAHYLMWFEEGRTEWLRRSGRTYRSLEDEGILLAVTEVRIEYRKPVRYDDVILVTTRLLDRRRVTLRFGYTIRLEGGEDVVAEGETELACIDRSGRLRRLPPGLGDPPGPD